MSIVRILEKDEGPAVEHIRVDVKAMTMVNGEGMVCYFDKLTPDGAVRFNCVILLKRQGGYVSQKKKRRGRE